MEFNEKLQNLRKQKGITQDDLADALFVSRTAVSKWESGRGYPSIDSLKSIAKFFGVTLDELLSGNEVLAFAEEHTKQKSKQFCDLIFGLLDTSVLLLFFLPFFGEKVNGAISEVSLLSISDISPYVKIVFFALVILTAVFGVLTLALQKIEYKFWVQSKSKISVLQNVLSIVLFTITLQPYAAIYLFLFLIIKVFLLIKW